MAKQRQNATMWQREDKSLVFTVTGTDLTTATVIEWEMSETDRSASALVAKTLAASTITVNSATQCTVDLPGADTDDISGGKYHELRVTDSTGNEQVVSTGTITINLSTTKD